jgi:hypothetical protein
VKRNCGDFQSVGKRRWSGQRGRARRETKQPGGATAGARGRRQSRAEERRGKERKGKEKEGVKDSLPPLASFLSRGVIVIAHLWEWAPPASQHLIDLYTTVRSSPVIPGSASSLGTKTGPMQSFQYSPPSINVTLINVNSLYLLTKLYSPHIAN